jgi:hypothetical protein
MWLGRTPTPALQLFMLNSRVTTRQIIWSPQDVNSMPVGRATTETSTTARTIASTMGVVTKSTTNAARLQLLHRFKTHTSESTSSS